MTPEHTDRDLRERIEAEVEALRAEAAHNFALARRPLLTHRHAYGVALENAADRLAALTASEGPREFVEADEKEINNDKRVCPTCGLKRDTARPFYFTSHSHGGGYLPCTDPFHGIEASEGGLDLNEPLEPDATVEVPFGAPVPESPAESVPDSEVRELREALEKLLAVVDAETIERTYAFPNARRLTEAADIARRALAPDPEHPNQEDPNA